MILVHQDLLARAWFTAGPASKPTQDMSRFPAGIAVMV